jgi:transcriptional regulator GlxA family with amidase domain
MSTILRPCWSRCQAFSTSASGIFSISIRSSPLAARDAPLDPEQKRLIAVLRDEIRHPEQQPLRLPIPNEERLARVAHALLDDVADDRTLDGWAKCAGMARRTFMRAFSTQVGMPFGRWREQALLFAALEMLAQNKSVTEVAIAVGYDSVSALIGMFRTMLGSTTHIYFRSKQEGREAAIAGLPRR